MNNDSPFDTLYFLIGIKAVVTLSVTPLDTLCVQCSDRGRLILISAFADSHYSLSYKIFYSSIFAPFAEKHIYGLLPGEVPRQYPPLATADQQVQNGIKYGSERIFNVSSI